MKLINSYLFYHDRHKIINVQPIQLTSTRSTSKHIAKHLVDQNTAHRPEDKVLLEL